jgi:hypothetical protein
MFVGFWFQAVGTKATSLLAEKLINRRRRLWHRLDQRLGARGASGVWLRSSYGREG